jgi:hypothetical protein
MFESSVVDILKSDGVIATKLSQYMGEPAIFSDQAPEGSSFPYIVFYITITQVDDSCIHDFNLMVDFYGGGTSAKSAREICERIEYLLDRKHIAHDRYDTIRCFFFAGSAVPESDPRITHYNLQFNCRGGRKKWMQQI